MTDESPSTKCLVLKGLRQNFSTEKQETTCFIDRLPVEFFFLHLQMVKINYDSAEWLDFVCFYTPSINLFEI